MSGSSTVRTRETFTCDCCEATHVGDRTDLRGLGWVRHGGVSVAFLMCKACEEYFAPVWERRRAQRDAEREARGS